MTSLGRASTPESRASSDKPLINCVSATLHPQYGFCLSRYSVAPLTMLYLNLYFSVRKDIRAPTSLLSFVFTISVCDIGASSTPSTSNGVVFSMRNGAASALMRQFAIAVDDPSLMPAGDTGTLSSDDYMAAATL